MQPWDKGLLKAVEKGILASDLGLTPSNDGNIIRIPIPALTEERRKELVKVIHKFAEEGRVAIRHARTETMTRIKKTEHVSSDDQKHSEKEVQKLHDELKGQGFSVLGFPSNDFGGQEPGEAEEIATFCQRNYGVTFPMFSKLVTKAGPEQSPIYTYLGATGHLPAWNFSKYLVGKNGKVIKAYKSGVKPEDATLRADIEAALKQ